MKKTLTIITIAILFTGCTAVNHHLPINSPFGFWMGLWHGMISPLTFVISLFSDSVSVWDTNNNGGWYVFGFLLGAGALTSGSVKASK